MLAALDMLITSQEWKEKVTAAAYWKLELHVYCYTRMMYL